jgi:hypothetical protein
MLELTDPERLAGKRAGRTSNQSIAYLAEPQIIKVCKSCPHLLKKLHPEQIL